MKDEAIITRVVVQGSYEVSDDPRILFTTLLGSCVATCLFDKSAKVGGMNHFLLSGCRAHDPYQERYGSYAMEVLINELLKSGARKEEIRAKVFGGARMSSAMSDIGPENSQFAVGFLRDEGIPILAQSIGGAKGRRIKYHPSSGGVKMQYIADVIEHSSNRNVSYPGVGDIDLFR